LIWGAFDMKSETIALENASGVTAVLSVDLGGNLNLNGSDSILTVPILNAWAPLLLKLTDSGGTVRIFVPSLAKGLVWNGSQLVDGNDLNR
jgi:hypothetical protein